MAARRAAAVAVFLQQGSPEALRVTLRESIEQPLFLGLLEKCMFACLRGQQDETLPCTFLPNLSDIHRVFTFFLTLDAGAPAAEAIKRMEQVYIMPLLRTTISKPLIFVGFLLVFCSGLPEVCNRLRNRVAGTKASGYRVPNVKD